MNTPTIYTPEQIIKNAGRVKAGLPDGRWVEARAEGWSGLCLLLRLRCAWLVFTGRADVLRWSEQPPIAKPQEGASHG